MPLRACRVAAEHRPRRLHAAFLPRHVGDLHDSVQLSLQAHFLASPSTHTLPWTNVNVFVRSCNQDAQAAEAKAAEEAKVAGLAAEPDATAAGNKENAA